jgi:glutamate carboxypeptidase
VAEAGTDERFPLGPMVDALHRLVEVESFSTDAASVEKCAAVIDELCRDLLESGAERLGSGLVWRRPGRRPVLLLCHFDTVWPTGTLEGFPFTVDDGVVRGPGAFDMKAGIVQALYAVRESGGPVTILFTGDEEIGSAASRPLIEQEARGSRAVLVMEPSEEGKIKIARKGVGTWTVEVRGRASHAGLAPEKGANAVVELAHQILRISGLGDPDAGTTVSVTTTEGGSAPNVIPERAACSVDVRMWTADEADRVRRALAALEPVIEGTSIGVEGEINRGPMERSASEDLYRRLVGLGYDIGTAEVGGASDGNFTAAIGVPTLDGLGPVGGGAHARDEHVIADEMPRRAEMVARLIDDLAADG